MGLDSFMDHAEREKVGLGVGMDRVVRSTPFRPMGYSRTILASTLVGSLIIILRVREYSLPKLSIHTTHKNQIFPPPID
jgi:hypothetical protein